MYGQSLRVIGFYLVCNIMGRVYLCPWTTVQPTPYNIFSSLVWSNSRTYNLYEHSLQYLLGTGNSGNRGRRIPRLGVSHKSFNRITGQYRRVRSFSRQVSDLLTLKYLYYCMFSLASCEGLDDEKRVTERTVPYIHGRSIKWIQYFSAVRHRGSLIVLLRKGIVYPIHN